MAYKIVILLNVIFQSIGFCQSNKSINGIIVLDGKLIECEGQFEVLEEDKIKVLPFSYIYGEIFLSENDYAYLKNIKQPYSININVSHFSADSVKRIRCPILSIAPFFENYLILRFTTLKNNKYYLGITSPSFYTKPHKKEKQIVRF